MLSRRSRPRKPENKRKKGTPSRRSRLGVLHVLKECLQVVSSKRSKFAIPSLFRLICCLLVNPRNQANTDRGCHGSFTDTLDLSCEYQPQNAGDHDQQDSDRKMEITATAAILYVRQRCFIPYRTVRPLPPGTPIGVFCFHPFANEHRHTPWV